MAKNKMEKNYKGLKKDFNKFVNEAKENTKEAVDHLKDRTK